MKDCLLLERAHVLSWLSSLRDCNPEMHPFKANSARPSLSLMPTTLRNISSVIYCKGRSIYYVRTKGGRGLREMANYANDSTDRLRENANQGGRGSKMLKILQTL